MPMKELTELEKTLHSFQDYLEKKSGILYKGKMVYIQTTPVSKNLAICFLSQHRESGMGCRYEILFSKNGRAGIPVL